MESAFANVDNHSIDAVDSLQLVGFKIGDELFGVDVLLVQEILKDINITPVPDTPPFVKGVINLRGNIIPIIDLKQRVKAGNLKATDNERWVIVLNINDRVTGFTVSEVGKVIKLSDEMVMPPPEMISAGLKSDYISGVINTTEHGLITILDFNKILVIEEFKKASSALKGIKDI